MPTPHNTASGTTGGNTDARPNEPGFEDVDALGRLLDPRLNADLLWAGGELADVLRHQLDVPLAVDVQSILGSVPALQAAQLCDQARPTIRNLRELFRHPAPPAGLLTIVAELAHHELRSAEPLLSREVARLCYYLSVAIARSKYQTDIAVRLHAADISATLRSFSQAPWVDEETQALLRQRAAEFPAMSG